MEMSFVAKVTFQPEQGGEKKYTVHGKHTYLEVFIPVQLLYRDIQRDTDKFQIQHQL